ncbi:MAG TPA: CDGSH iron-sulfur domain-containing protein [Rhodospirillales bacterium]|jgi:CDGSH-type Zn-finger protein|nr:glutamate synthase [Rhodospirillaceae bacterium]HJN22660.1 CDGSH iron-sulfur domain-containing protein [Rhodospirillales bacterium]|tara:strand:+ start:208 stop:447 length:240 start_codon:yes stop_codon:yes gene_type:complete
MNGPVMARKGPYDVEVEAGEEYYWCTCGRSKKQPWCDGVHKEVGMKPLVYTAEKSTALSFCGCKAIKTPPFCDGTHSSL